MTNWKYLEHPAFNSRQTLAAGNLRDVNIVIELGSYKTSIRPFLHVDQTCYCIDPRLEGHHPYDIKETFPTKAGIPTWLLCQPHGYGLVMLGMDLALSDSGRHELYELINGARRVVIEFPPAHTPSVIQLEGINRVTNKSIKMTIGLDLRDNDFGDLSSSAPLMAERKLFVLE